MSKKGFTLVELSIVLVIIGLLIGGILVAQSLIDSTKVNRIISGLEQYNATARLFKDRFNQLPGDSILFEGDTSNVLFNSNNDGAIEYAPGFGLGVAASNVFGGEVAHFWEHLSSSNMTQGKVYSSDVITSVQPGIHVPEFLDGGVVAAYNFLGIGFADISSNNYLMYYDIQNLNSNSLIKPYPGSGNIYHGAASPEIAISVEKKADDGNAVSGDYVIISYRRYSSGTSISDCNTGMIGSGDDVTCIIGKRIDSD